MKNHDPIGLHEYPEYGALTGKGKRGPQEFPSASSDGAGDAAQRGLHLSKLTKGLALGTVTALTVSGAVISGNEELTNQLLHHFSQSPISQGPVDPKDLIHTVHSWDEGVIVLKASCTEEGSLVYSCTGCDATRTEIIPASGHTPAKSGADTAPGCTEPGKSADTVCEICGALLAEGAEIPPAGHIPGEAVSTEPGCTEPGRTEAVSCTVCGMILTEPSETEPLGHDWGDFSVTKAPSCTGSGTRTRSCSRCGASENESVSPLGHTDTNRDYRCDRCGAATVSVRVSEIRTQSGSPKIEVVFALSGPVQGLDPEAFSDSIGVEWKSDGDSGPIRVLLYPELGPAERSYSFRLILYGIAGDGDSVTVLDRVFTFAYGPEQLDGTKPIVIN